MEKLVRDLIPDIIEAETGAKPIYKKVKGEELSQFFRYKVMEEAQEVINSKNEVELAEEIADLLSVLVCYAAHEGIGFNVIDVQEQKYKAKGAFEEGIIVNFPEETV